MDAGGSWGPLRSYDPALGRFNGIDPVTHFSQGTSVAFDNNPVFWADPSGANAVTNGKGITWGFSWSWQYDNDNSNYERNNNSGEIGIVSTGELNLPGLMVNREKGINLGYYTLYSFSSTNDDGEVTQGWIASRDGKFGYRDDYYIGVSYVAEFAKNSGSYAALASFENWATDEGGAWEAYKSTWTLQNIMNGLTVGGGGFVINAHRVQMRSISTNVRAQKQTAEHIVGGNRLGTNSYLNSLDDAQSVLDAAHNGTAKILHTNASQNRVYVQYDNVTGYYNNNGTILETNKFLIKGGKSATVVPIHPSSTKYK